MASHGDMNEGTLSGIFETPEFARKFIVKRELGRGANSVVYLAEDLLLQRDVALKVMKFQADEIARERFAREARVCMNLKHPNIVQVYSFGEKENEAFIAMELLSGETLEQTLRNCKTLSKVQFEEIFLQVLGALEAAHECHLLHRDIKPANIMIANDGAKQLVKLLDFGMSKGVLQGSSLSKTLTVADTGVGTPAYMSPEQCRGQKADFSSDIYSLSCVMYECLLGRPPFVGNSAVETMYMHMNQEAVFPADVDTGVKIPLEVMSTVLQGLKKDSAARPPSAAALRALLLESLKSDRYFARNISSTKAPYLVLLGVLVGVGACYLLSTTFLHGKGKNVENVSKKVAAMGVPVALIVKKSVNARCADQYEKSLELLQEAEASYKAKNDKISLVSCLRERIDSRLFFAKSPRGSRIASSLAAAALADIDEVLTIQPKIIFSSNLSMQMCKAYKILGKEAEAYRRLGELVSDIKAKGAERDVPFARILAAYAKSAYQCEDYSGALKICQESLNIFDSNVFGRTDPAGTCAALTYVDSLASLGLKAESKRELDKTENDLLHRTYKHNGLNESLVEMQKFLYEHGDKKASDFFGTASKNEADHELRSYAATQKWKQDFEKLRFK